MSRPKLSEILHQLREVMGEHDYSYHRRNIRDVLETVLCRKDLPHWKQVPASTSLYYHCYFSNDRLQFIPTGEYRLDIVFRGEVMLQFIFASDEQRRSYLPCIRVYYRKYDKSIHKPRRYYEEILVKHVGGSSLCHAKPDRQGPDSVIQPRPLGPLDPPPNSME